MADRTILRINNVRRGNIVGASATNVLSVNEEYVHQIVPRFVPNLYQGLGVNQDHKWWEIKVIFDSDTDIFDTFYSVTGPNTAMNNFWIEFELAPRCAVIGTPAAYTNCAIVVAANATLTANNGDPYAIFEAGDQIIITDAGNPLTNGTYTILTVTPTVITILGALGGANNPTDTSIKIWRGTRETWCYSQTYVADRREGTIEEGRERQTYEYDFISHNFKGIYITKESYPP